MIKDLYRKQAVIRKSVILHIMNIQFLKIQQIDNRSMSRWLKVKF